MQYNESRSKNTGAYEISNTMKMCYGIMKLMDPTLSTTWRKRSTNKRKQEIRKEREEKKGERKTERGEGEKGRETK